MEEISEYMEEINASDDIFRFDESAQSSTKKNLSSNHTVFNGSLAHQYRLPSALKTSKAWNSWIVDSGASDHMTDAFHLFTSYSPCAGNVKVKIAHGSLSPVAGKGRICLSDSIVLDPVLHVPNLSCSLLSISQLIKNSNYSVKFFPSHCIFQELPSGKTIGNAKEYNGLYYFEESAASKQGLADFVDQNRKLFSKISAVCLSLVPWIQVSRSRSLLLMVNPAIFLVAVGMGALIHIILLAFNVLGMKSLSALSGGGQSVFAKKENSSALVLVASQKTLPVMVAVVEQLGGALGESGLLVLPCIAAHLIQIVLDSILVNFWLQKDISSNNSKVA